MHNAVRILRDVKRRLERRKEVYFLCPEQNHETSRAAEGTACDKNDII